MNPIEVLIGGYEALAVLAAVKLLHLMWRH